MLRTTVTSVAVLCVCGVAFANSGSEQHEKMLSRLEQLENRLSKIETRLPKDEPSAVHPATPPPGARQADDIPIATGLDEATELYTSTGLIYVRPVVPKILYDTERNRVLPMFDSFLASQVELIRSQRVIDMALNDESWRSHGRPYTLETKARFREHLDVTRPPRTNLIVVAFEDPESAAAQAGVAAIIKAYEKLFVEEDTKSGQQRMQVLEEKRASSQAELTRIRNTMFEIAGDFGPDGIQQMYTYKVQAMNGLEDLIRQVTLLIAEADVTLDGDEEVINTESLTVEQIALSDRDMRRLLNYRNTEIDRLSLMLHDYGDKHRKIVQQRRIIDLANVAVQKHATQIRQAFARQMAGSTRSAPGTIPPGVLAQRLRERLERLKSLREDANLDMLALTRKKQLIDNLEQDAATTRNRLEEARLRIDQINTESRVSGRIQIISNGDEPLNPMNSGRRKQLAMIGLVGGGSMGFGLVLLVGLMDRRLRSSEDARDRIGTVRLLGILPGLPDDLSDPDHARIAGHCLHHIRTMLQIESNRQNRQVFAITSPTSGTGKTSLTLALGLSFAASGAKTLLVDCDLSSGGLTSRLQAIIRRRVGQILERQGLITSEQLAEALRSVETSGKRLGEALVDLGVLGEEEVAQALALQEEARIGLLDALDGEPFDHCVVETSTPGLSILPIGGAKSYDMSRLSPTAVRRVIDEARHRFDTILLDSGPVPGTVETSIVAAEAEGVVVIVSRGEQRQQASKTIAFLDSIGAHVAGLVFNRAATSDVARSAYLTSGSVSGTPANGDGQIHDTQAPADAENVGPVVQAVADTARDQSESS